MVTLLNNSGTSVFPGDMLEWTFFNETLSRKSSAVGRKKADPRRISVRMATATSERVIGRCLSFAKPGETFDLVTVPRRIIEPHTPLTVLPLHSPFPPPH